MKKTQLLMIWFLPLIVIGGLFYPLLGYLVLAMMAVFLTLAFFRGRYWCWNLCPRGAFLDLVVSRASLGRPLPRVFLKQWFRWLVFFLFIAYLIFRLIQAGGNLIAIGAVFVGMCVLTTVIAVILGMTGKHRGWCVICPMGTLQAGIARMGKKPGQ